MSGSYSCSCDDGYEQIMIDEFNFMCQDINECENDPCDKNAICGNSNGAFDCKEKILFKPSTSP